MGMKARVAIVAVAVLLVILTIPATAAELSEENQILSVRAETACEDYGLAYNISPELLEAIIERESHGNPHAENKGCIGLMQISARWHGDRMERLGVTDLYDERGNVKVGADYLQELFREYEDPCLVLDIYNGNSQAFSNYERGIVSDYAGGVLERAAELERLHGK